MTTWEDILGPVVGLANYFVCTTCLSPIFRGSTGYFGQKLILPKVAPPGGLRDDLNHAITFQCSNCTDKAPVVVPVVHPSGESLDHINISQLQDAQDQKETVRVFGDYDARQEIAAIWQQGAKRN